MSASITTPDDDPSSTLHDSPAAWRRLAVALVIGTIGSIGMWSFVVSLPAVQAGFGVDRAAASTPYTMTMLGFAFGGLLMGRLADRYGAFTPLLAGGVALALGYAAGSQAPNIAVYAAAQTLVGLGASASFAPLMADISHWFRRRRGIAITLASSGNYLAGALWPPILQRITEAYDWRAAHMTAAIFCLVTLVPLAFAMRARIAREGGGHAAPVSRFGGVTLSNGTLLALLVAAGFSCCVAMAMPQVHIVAYCADLGYGPARGAQMLATMMLLGIVSRIVSGLVADRIGGLSTLLLGSTLQGVALFLYLFFDGPVSLFVVSGLFGLFQGGLVPMYAVIVREYFPASKAATTTGAIIMATLFGMAFGGWVSGAIFDATGSYRMAFLNGLAWNFVNVAIAAFLLIRRRPTQTATSTPAMA